MKTLKELREAVKSGTPLEDSNGHIISDVDLATYNSRRKTVIVEVNAYGGFVSEKIRNIRPIDFDKMAASLEMAVSKL